MSRIYNLKPVVPRTGVRIADRSSDVPAHSRKLQPEGHLSPGSQTLPLPQERATQQVESRARDGPPVVTTETTGLQSVQRQVEQLQLREQEVGSSSHGDGNPRHGLQRDSKWKTAEGQKVADAHTETHKAQVLSPRQDTGARLQSKPPQIRSFTINGRGAQSPNKTPKPLERDRVRSSPISPSSVSPSPTSSISPTPSLSATPSLSPSSSLSSTPLSPSLSSPLFSIRSASGVQGKRGTTITITPRRLAAGTPALAQLSGVAPQTPAPVPKAEEKGPKKRYPTVEEIVVIGGYQILENSCLVKNRGSDKAVRVCFDDSQLERVWEYPSEASVLVSLPGGGEELASDVATRAEPESDEQEEEEEEEVFMAHGSKSLGAGTGMARVIRVDESCRR